MTAAVTIFVLLAAGLFVALMRSLGRPDPDSGSRGPDQLDKMTGPRLTPASVTPVILSGPHYLPEYFPGPVDPSITEEARHGAQTHRAGEGYLSAPVAPTCERDDRSEGPATVAEPTNRSMGNWPMGHEVSIYREARMQDYARVARERHAAWQEDAARRARERTAQVRAEMAALRDKAAAEIAKWPHLDYRWEDRTDSFPAFIENGAV